MRYKNRWLNIIFKNEFFAHYVTAVIYIYYVILLLEFINTKSIIKLLLLGITSH